MIKQQSNQMQQQSNQMQQLINAINLSNQPTVPMNVQVDPAQSISQITPSATSPQAKQNDSHTATTVSTNNSSLKRKANTIQTPTRLKNNDEPMTDKLNDDSWTPTDKPLNTTNQQ